VCAYALSTLIDGKGPFVTVFPSPDGHARVATVVHTDAPVALPVATETLIVRAD